MGNMAVDERNVRAAETRVLSTVVGNSFIVAVAALRFANFGGLANGEPSILSDKDDIISESKVVDSVTSLGRQL